MEEILRRQRKAEEVIEGMAGVGGESEGEAAMSSSAAGASSSAPCSLCLSDYQLSRMGLVFGKGSLAVAEGLAQAGWIIEELLFNLYGVCGGPRSVKEAEDARENEIAYAIGATAKIKGGEHNDTTNDDDDLSAFLKHGRKWPVLGLYDAGVVC